MKEYHTPYNTGRAAAMVECFAKEHFGPGTKNKLFTHPAYNIELFLQYVPTEYWHEFEGMEFPATLTPEEQSTAWIGYHHALFGMEVRLRIGMRIALHNHRCNEGWSDNTVELHRFARSDEGYELQLKIGKYDYALATADINEKGITLLALVQDEEYITADEARRIIFYLAGAVYPRMDIGYQLRTLREEQELSTRELAEKAGLPHSHIVRIENGKYDVRVDTIAALSDALGSDIKITKRETNL